MTTILCSHRRPRRHAILWLVVHVNVGPEISHGAVGLANYLAKPSTVGGYHEVIDDIGMVTTASDGEEVNGAGTHGNQNGLHYCLIGYANQTQAQWGDPYSQAEIAILAGRLRAKCAEHSIPPVLLTPAQVRASQSGIVGHVTLRDAFPADTTHYDPGPAFPWAQLMAAISGPPAGDDDDLNKDEYLAVTRSEGVSGAGSYLVDTNKKLDKMIDLLNQLLAKP